MIRWAIVLGAAMISGAALYFLTGTYLALAPTMALTCAAAVALGVGVIAHLNTPDSEELEDGLE